MQSDHLYALKLTLLKQTLQNPHVNVVFQKKFDSEISLLSLKVGDLVTSLKRFYLLKNEFISNAIWNVFDVVI